MPKLDYIEVMFRYPNWITKGYRNGRRVHKATHSNITAAFVAAEMQKPKRIYLIRRELVQESVQARNGSLSGRVGEGRKASPEIPVRESDVWQSNTCRNCGCAIWYDTDTEQWVHNASAIVWCYEQYNSTAAEPKE